MDRPKASIARIMVVLARCVAIVVGLGCGVVLFGYALHVGALVDLHPGLRGMSPAVALALCLIALALAGRPWRHLATILGGLGIAIGLVSLTVEIVYGRDLIGPFIATHVFLFNVGRSGTMSAATAVCLVALGIAVVARKRPRVADLAGAVALIIGGFILLGYIYGVRELRAMPFFDAMAPLTALAILMLALASIASRPTGGVAAIVASPNAGGRATRRLLGFTLATPIAGFILLVATDAHRLGPGVALAALVVLTVVPLSLLILRDGRALDALQAEKRKKIEAREASAREIRLVTNALPVLIAFVDKDLIYRFANRAYEDWFYLTPEEVVGRSMQDLLGVDGFADRRHFFEKALAGEEARFEVPWPHRDGRPRDADIHYLPRIALDGTIDGFYVFVADITDRKRVERALLAMNVELEERVAMRTRERDQIWQSSKDMLCVASLEGYFLSLNPAWTETLGWSKELLMGAPFLDLVHPDDRDATFAAAERAASGVTQTSFENRYRHQDGTYRWFSWNAVPRDGFIYASGRDITEEKEAEARQQVLEEQLRQSQKMEAVGQLTGGLAHDFNNLLTGITGSLDLLDRRMKQGRLADIERYIVAAQGAAKRAAALTHRLLAFSRRQTLEPKPTDTNRLAAGMDELIRRTVGPGIGVAIVGAEGLWTILVDQNQLENALLNLCINARDAMPDGGRITIETANTVLDEHAAAERDVPPGGYVVLRVSDTGTGMPPDVIERVFDPFFTTKPLGQGTGLGLSMIYGFVRQSGGYVDIASEVGQGTTMCLYLPRYHGDAVGDMAPAAAGPTTRVERGETVLVIDDEPTVRMLVTDLLEDAGFTAIEAADGAGGLKILRSTVAIDLLVTDVGLPGGMNGRQVADAGRAIRPGLKVLFITGYAENAVIGNGQLDPGMRVLTKPFAMEALGGLVREMIDKG